MTEGIWTVTKAATQLCSVEPRCLRLHHGQLLPTLALVPRLDSLSRSAAKTTALISCLLLVLQKDRASVEHMAVVLEPHTLALARSDAPHQSTRGVATAVTSEHAQTIRHHHLLLLAHLHRLARLIWR